MIDAISGLSDDQAIQAVKLFIDLSSTGIWADGVKPTPGRMKQIPDGVVASAPADIKPKVTAVAQSDSDGGTRTQARVARLVLERLNSNPAFAPAVQKATETAKKAIKFGIDPITGAFVLGLLVFTGKYTIGGNQFDPGAKVSEILHEIPDIIKAVPAEIWTAVVASMK